MNRETFLVTAENIPKTLKNNLLLRLLTISPYLVSAVVDLLEKGELGPVQVSLDQLVVEVVADVGEGVALVQQDLVDVPPTN